MSPVVIQTRAGQLIGLVTAGVLSVAAWEIGEWLVKPAPAPTSSHSAEMGRALAATVAGLQQQRALACACRLAHSLNLEVPYAEF